MKDDRPSVLSLLWQMLVIEKLPRIVFPGQEIEVELTFEQFAYVRNPPALVALEEMLRDQGVELSAVSTEQGHKWHLDRDSAGKVRVRFVRKASKRR